MIIHDKHDKSRQSGGHVCLAPSSASRWLSYAASITLVEEHGLTEREGGPAARAGVALHRVLERAFCASVTIEACDKWRRSACSPPSPGLANS